MELWGYRFGYQGEFAEEDPETGFNHFELREYDPVIARTMVVDPARQFASPYLWVGNNPISAIDPTGGEVPWLEKNGEIVFVSDAEYRREYEWKSWNLLSWDWDHFGSDKYFSFIEKQGFENPMNFEESQRFMENTNYMLVPTHMLEMKSTYSNGSPMNQIGLELSRTAQVWTRFAYVPKNSGISSLNVEMLSWTTPALAINTTVVIKSEISYSISKIHTFGKIGEYIYNLGRNVKVDNVTVYKGWNTVPESSVLFDYKPIR